MLGARPSAHEKGAGPMEQGKLVAGSGANTLLEVYSVYLLVPSIMSVTLEKGIKEAPKGSTPSEATRVTRHNPDHISCD